VERVLRNRAAAQKSREVKKQQLEKIEQERDVLKEQNEILLATNRQLEALQQQLLDKAQRLEEENQRLRDRPDCTQAPNPGPDEKNVEFTVDPGFTLDPTSLLSTCGIVNTPVSSPCMTHQPAVLVCDLPCLQGISTMTFLPVLTILLAFMEAISSRFWMTSPLALTSTLVWQLLQNALLCYLLIRSWKSSLIATEMLPQRVEGQACSSVLAHPRIATDCSLQPAATARSVSFASIFSSDLASWDVSGMQRGGLFSALLDRTRTAWLSTNRRKLPISWMVSLGLR